MAPGAGLAWRPASWQGEIKAQALFSPFAGAAASLAAGRALALEARAHFFGSFKRSTADGPCCVAASGVTCSAERAPGAEQAGQAGQGLGSGLGGVTVACRRPARLAAAPWQRRAAPEQLSASQAPPRVGCAPPAHARPGAPTAITEPRVCRRSPAVCTRAMQMQCKPRGSKPVVAWVEPAIERAVRRPLWCPPGAMAAPRVPNGRARTRPRAPRAPAPRAPRGGGRGGRRGGWRAAALLLPLLCGLACAPCAALDATPAFRYWQVTNVGGCAPRWHVKEVQLLAEAPRGAYGGPSWREKKESLALPRPALHAQGLVCGAGGVWPRERVLCK